MLMLFLIMGDKGFARPRLKGKRSGGAQLAKQPAAPRCIIINRSGEAIMQADVSILGEGTPTARGAGRWFKIGGELTKLLVKGAHALPAATRQLLPKGHKFSSYNVV
jgi:hypothetical protein